MSLALGGLFWSPLPEIYTEMIWYQLVTVFVGLQWAASILLFTTDQVSLRC